MRFFLFVIFLLIIPGSILAQGADTDFSVDLPLLEKQVVDQLTRALYETEYTPDIPAIQTKPVVPKELRGIWFRGAKIEHETLLAVNLEFDDLNSERPPVQIRVGFEGSKVLVKHSHPGKGKLVGGISMELDRKKRREYFLSGHLDSGVALFFPTLVEGLRALVVCPRSWGTPPIVDQSQPGWADQQRSPSEYQVLQKSEYDLKQVRFEALSAFITTEITFGYEGSGEVRLLTSPTLNPSDPFKDAARGKAVRLEVSYGAATEQPQTPFPSKEAALAGVVGGVRFAVYMHGPAGHEREIFLDNSITVQRVESAEGVMVEAGNSSWPVKPGGCYLVASRSAVSERYSMKQKVPLENAP